MPKVTVTADALGDSIADGTYHVIFSDGETKYTSEDSKQPNNEYWNVEMTVQDGPQAGRKDWVNVMLPPYALYTLGSLLQAFGYEKDAILKGMEVELFEDDLTDKKKGVAIVGREALVVVKTKTKKGQENRNHNFKVYDEESWSPDGGDDDVDLP